MFFNKLVVYLVLLSTIPVSLFFAISCSNYNKELFDRSKNQSIFTVEQYNKSIEQSISELIKKTNGLLVDDTILTFSANIEDLYHNTSKMDDLLYIMNNLGAERRILFKEINSIYIYYPENKLFISDLGYYDENEFYDRQIIEILKNANVPKFGYLLIGRIIDYPESYTGSNKYLGNILTIIRSIPFSNNGALLVLDIKEEMFFTLDNSEQQLADTFLIIDKNGNEIFRSDQVRNEYNNALTDIIDSIPDTHESGFITSNYNPNVVTFYSGLNKFGLRTLIISPNFYAYAFFNSLINTLIVFLSISCLSLLISYYASNRLYNPIKSLVSFIAGQNNTIEMANSRNEFHYIKDNYSRVIEQNDEIKEKLSANLPLLRELFFKNIIEGKNEDIKSIVNKADFLGIDIGKASNFTVYVILIDKTIEMLEDNNLFRLHYFKEILNSIIRNELNHKNMEILYNYTEDDTLILISWNDQSNSNVMGIPEKINSAVKKHINHNIYISVGLTVNKISDLSYSYTTAIDAINYIGIKNNKSSIIYANEIVQPARTSNHPLLMDEKQLLLSILNCDCQKALTIFNRLFNDIIEQDISYEYFQQIIVQIINDILKFLESNGISILPIGSNIYKEVLNIKTIKNTKIWCQHILSKIICYIESNRTDHHTALVNDIINYIHQNYNKNINLETTAEFFSLSRQHFGKIFYDITGKNFNDYLNEVRLDISLKYLRETNYSVKTIAENVGFGSSQYYIKLFKDKYGITPGKYRKKINCFCIPDVNNETIRSFYGSTDNFIGKLQISDL